MSIYKNDPSNGSINNLIKEKEDKNKDGKVEISVPKKEKNIWVQKVSDGDTTTYRLKVKPGEITQGAFQVPTWVAMSGGVKLVAVFDIVEYLDEGLQFYPGDVVEIIDGQMAETSTITFKDGTGFADTLLVNEEFVESLPDFNGEAYVFELDSFEDGAVIPVPALGSSGFEAEGLLMKDVDNEATIPGLFTLHDNYPNPFNPETRIRFELQRSSQVRIDVLNNRGQIVRTLVAQDKAAGSHSVVWDGLNNAGKKMASGLYIYRLQVAGFSQSKKMLLLK